MFSLIFYVQHYGEFRKNKPGCGGGGGGSIIPFIFTPINLNVQILEIRLTWVEIREVFLLLLCDLETVA